MYSAKVNWYNESEKCDVVDHMIICASSWNDVVEKINCHYSYINSIEITQIQVDECDLIYVPENMMDAVIKENQY